jgi:class 3 adenylate cyclase
VPRPERNYRWTWELKSPPEALWPLVSDTDRFNRDCGYPPVSEVGKSAGGIRRLRTRVLGIVIEWDEHAFEWVAPHRFTVERDYLAGPLARMTVYCELKQNAQGGTTLAYAMSVRPSGVLGHLATPLTIGRHAAATTERVFRRYDDFAQAGLRRSAIAHRVTLAPGGEERAKQIGERLAAEAAQSPTRVARLLEHVLAADDPSVMRIRAYRLAEEWDDEKRPVLELLLHATRAGLLDFNWETMCPHCRGAADAERSLAGLSSDVHCASCGVDFTAEFDRSVELNFSPNPSIRPVQKTRYCVGGPQVTPHIVAQCRVQAGERSRLAVEGPPGRYRVRCEQRGIVTTFRVAPEGASALEVDLTDGGASEGAVAPGGEVRVSNSLTETQLVLVEHAAWTDHATTAAEVATLQVFRDLFARELLRPGEQIGVGSLTLVFTDLKNSTQMYQDIGDAPAFGRVLSHFEVLRAAVTAEGGAIVKTMGDAIMAVFPRPAPAVRAMIQAQRALAMPAAPAPGDAAAKTAAAAPAPLALKAGIHTGPCLAMTQNERLDYFGTTVNIAARLCGLCRGRDLVVSAATFNDAEVTAALNDLPVAERESVMLKGFADRTFTVFRLSMAAPEPRVSAGAGSSNA